MLPRCPLDGEGRHRQRIATSPRSSMGVFVLWRGGLYNRGPYLCQERTVCLKITIWFRGSGTTAIAALYFNPTCTSKSVKPLSTILGVHTKCTIAHPGSSSSPQLSPQSPAENTNNERAEAANPGAKPRGTILSSVRLLTRSPRQRPCDVVNRGWANIRAGSDTNPRVQHRGTHRSSRWGCRRVARRRATTRP
jgi:hypothetical protein